MSHHEIDFGYARGYPVNGGLWTMILATDVDDCQFLTTHFVDGKTDAIFAGNSNEHQCSSGSKKVNGLIDGRLLSGTFINHIKTKGFLGEDFTHDILTVGITGPRGTGSGGDLYAGIDFVRDIDRTGISDPGGDHTTEANGASPKYAHGRTGENVRLIDSIDPDGKWFTKYGLILSQFTMRGKATFPGHNDIIAKTSFKLAWATEEFQFAAGVFPAQLTLIALVTRNSRFDDYRIPDFDMADRPSDFDDGSGAFVTDAERILYNLRTNTSGLIVVDVAAADANPIDLEQYICIVYDSRLGHVAEFHLSNSN